MNPRGFEPRSTGPKPVILSVELRVLTQQEKKGFYSLVFIL